MVSISCGKSAKVQINPGAFVKVVIDLKLAKFHSDHGDELLWKTGRVRAMHQQVGSRG